MLDEEKTTIFQCRHCGNKTIFEIHGEYQQKSLIDSRHSAQVFDVITWRTKKCRTCSNPTLEKEYSILTITYDHPDEGGASYSHEEIEGAEILYPVDSTLLIPQPSPDMPEDVAEDFNEARAIVERSPRASAALLRLALQKLCVHLGQPGKVINDDIAALVKNGLPVKIQQSLDIIRVVGNNAVHPGELDLRDNKETVLTLFKIINFIIDEMITRPREIERIYNTLPENARRGIENRDKNSRSLDH